MGLVSNNQLPQINIYSNLINTKMRYSDDLPSTGDVKYSKYSVFTYFLCTFYSLFIVLNNRINSFKHLVNLK
jgi:hypothetical protein